MKADTVAPRPSLLSLEGVDKSFGGVRALTNASLEVEGGEIHALLGENGAGKSTLVKIIAGALQRDAGTIRWGGDPVEVRSFRDAEQFGIHIVYQQLNILDHLTVAENLTLAREHSRLSFRDVAEERERAAAALAALGVDLDVGTPAGRLSVAERQLIEIARAVWGHVRLLIMDEPTASLGDREIDQLFDVLRRLREQQLGIVYISHKLEEVFRIADRITVLRDGHTVGTVIAADTSQDDLIAMMVGRRLGHEIRRGSTVADREVLAVESLSTDTGLREISFTLRRGEVLGIYGLLGSGRTELARALFGVDPLSGGQIRVDGRAARFASPAQAKRRGLGLVTEDRADAAYPLLTVRVNLTCASSDLIAPRGWLRYGRERSLARRMITALRIRTPGDSEPLGQLSGGNQQKVVVGRWLVRDVPILIMDDPTAGIDVGAKDELYGLISEMTADGTALIMTSSELPELLALSDRILILRQGQMVGILEGENLTQENVLRMAVAGVGPEGPGAADASRQAAPLAVSP